MATNRHFAPISAEDFKAKVIDLFRDDWNIKGKLWKDIKVSFSFENADFGDDPHGFGPEGLMGVRTLGGEGALQGGEGGSPPLTIWGMAAGGDWEHSVYFVLYWDGKKVRAYVPTEGNPWNTTTKEAYGNDDKADLKNAKKRWPEVFKDAKEVEVEDFSFDPALIEQDILSRLVGTPHTPKTLEAHTPKPQQRKTLQERIEALTYYGTGDEAYELFCATCSLCYQMSGLGQDKQAAVLCGWAEEQAKESREWSEVDDDDTEKGYWGY